MTTKEAATPTPTPTTPPTAKELLAQARSEDRSHLAPYLLGLYDSAPLHYQGLGGFTVHKFSNRSMPDGVVYKMRGKLELLSPADVETIKRAARNRVVRVLGGIRPGEPGAAQVINVDGPGVRVQRNDQLFWDDEHPNSEEYGLLYIVENPGHQQPLETGLMPGLAEPRRPLPPSSPPLPAAPSTPTVEIRAGMEQARRRGARVNPAGEQSLPDRE